MRARSTLMLPLTLAFLAGCGGEAESGGSPDASPPDASTGAAPEAPPDATAGAPVEAPAEFVRFVEVGTDRAELQTAVVTYAAEDGAEVDLIGVVHLGDPAYYDALDASFDGYDAVLYEMIKPEDAGPVSVGEGASPVSMVQRGMCRALGLVFQLDSLDYARPNFVHADLTSERFAELWAERDESFFRIMMRALAASAGRETGLTPAALFDAARSPARKAKLKLLLGREFAQLERTLAGIGEVGEDGLDRSMILGARNEAAVEVLRARLAAGDRRVAILYGAGHGPDLDLRLVRELELARRALRWNTAWEIDATGG